MNLSRRLSIYLSFLVLISLIGLVDSTAQEPGIPLVGEPRTLAVNPFTNQALVVSVLPSRVNVLDLNTQTVLAQIPVGRVPAGAAILSRLNQAVVANSLDSTLSVIDLNTLQVQGTVRVGFGPRSVAIYDGPSPMAIVTHYLTRSVTVVDLAQMRLVQTIRVGNGPKDVAVDPDLKLALVVNELDHDLSVIDLHSLQETRRVPVGRFPRSVSINTETHLAAVANLWESFVSIIDLNSWNISSVATERFPLDVAANPLDNSLLVTSPQHLQHIDLNTQALIQSYALNKQTRGIGVNPFTNQAVVIDGQTDSLKLIQLSNPLPEIQAINPVTVARGSQETVLSIRGKGFLKTSIVSLSPSTALFPITFTDNHTLSITLPEAFLAQAGTFEVKVTNPAPEGGTSNGVVLNIENPVPVISAIDPASASAGGHALSVTLYGSGFVHETTVLVNGQPRFATYVSPTELRMDLSEADLAQGGFISLSVTNPTPGGGTSKTMSFLVSNPLPVLSSISPNTIKAGGPGFTLSLIGTGFVSTSTVLINNNPLPTSFLDDTRLEVQVPASAIAQAGNLSVVVRNPDPCGGTSQALTFTVTPASNVQPLPEGAYGKQYEDLVPSDAAIPAYDPKRFSLITGLVKDIAGNPLSGVTVGLHNQPQYGTARTDSTGRFSLPLDGGGTVTVTYLKKGYLEVHRQVQVDWNTIANTETITMIQQDPASTSITFDGNAQTILTHRSTPTTDSFGTRTLTMVFTGDNRVWVKDASGNEQLLTNITVRATEYPTLESMPAMLPPTSAFTYCAELAVDGAKSVRFEKPLVVYVDNFLGFPVGEIVPVGYYDRDRAVWVPQNNGKVVRLLDTNSDGIVDAYTDGINQYPAPGLTNPIQYPPNATFWRIEHDHFSPWDYNWPFGFPTDAIAPNPEGPPITDSQCSDDDNTCINSYVENRSRIFHEDIPIPGTDMTLHYASNRTKGNKSIITIPASGSGVPSSLLRIIVKMEVGGHCFVTILPAQPEQKAEFIWNGLDYLGKPILGSSIANISIGFVYPATYYSASDSFEQSFGQVGNAITGFLNPRQELITWKQSAITIYRGSTEAIAEGWTLSSHHNLSPADPYTLYKGDGTTLKNNAKVITTFAGNGQAGFNGDGGSATQASLWAPSGVVLDNAGNLYIADSWNDRIRKVDNHGIITTIAGNGQRGYSGDGGPAKQASFFGPSSLTIDNSGNLYIADFANHRVRKIDTNGNIITIAGNGEGGEYVPFFGDGGPATQSPLGYINGLALDNAGNLYIADGWYNRIRRVDTNGIITTVAGTGQYGYSGDGGPANQAQIGGPNGLAVDKAGNIFIVDGYNTNRIRKVDTSGIITTYAGNGQEGFSGDGGLATLASINGASGIVIDPSGNLYLSDSWGARIRKVDTSGIITTYAGNGQEGFSGDGGPAVQANLFWGTYLAVDSTGNIYIGDNGNQRVRKVSYPKTSGLIITEGDTAFSDPNGQGHIMNITGLHKSTIDLETGRTLTTFGYDMDNRLISITDRFGNQTTIQRDGIGKPVSITSPDGLVTRLTVDGDNHLTAITYPDTTGYSFVYTPDGLMTDKYDPKGNHFRQVYDADGRIIQVYDPEGGAWSYARSVNTSGTVIVTMQTGEGNITTYQDRTDSTGAYTTTTTRPSGSVSTFTRSGDGLTEVEQSACGTRQTMKYDLDSVFKYKYLKEFTQTTPAGLTLLTIDTRSYQDTNTDSVPDLITKTFGINGRTWTTVNNTLIGTLTSTSPVGRGITRTYDPSNLLTQRMTVFGLLPVNFGYDGRGKLTTITTGSRSSVITYDNQGNIQSLTTPDGKTYIYTYDIMNRLKSQTLPDGTSIGYDYDPNGNMTVLTNPRNISHGFEYTGVNLRRTMTAPMSGSYQYTYDKERNLKSILFPSGKQITNTYTAGLLSSTTTPEGVTSYTYTCGTNLISATRGTEGLAYTYDGSLLKTDTRTGILNQTIGYNYNNDFRLSSISYSGASQTFTYDSDGLLTGAGSFSIIRNAQNGLPETVSDGTMTNTRSFNGYGELDGSTFTVAGVPKYSFSLTRDQAGRITQKVETVDGITDTFEYGYDTNGRLNEVKKNGIVIEAYTYDPNGNRLTEINTIRGVNRSYTVSAEDHIITAGNETYQFDADGFLTSKTSGSYTSTYQYSSRGELLSASLPSGTTITYDHDPMGRRIAKRVNGTITEKYLWKDAITLLAVYDASDNLVMRFDYADGRMPVSMTYQGSTYYLAYDQIGSLKAVIDSSGIIVKKIDYDSFGNIISDSNPSFPIPFGFAGGLHDRDVGFFRFGARDYYPALGRWTAKDPIDFDGGDTNLYGYVGKNPVNRIDPSGLQWYKSRAVLLDIAALAFDVMIPLAPPLAPVFYVAGAATSVINTIFTYEDWRQGNAEWYDFAISAATTGIGFIPHPVALYGSDIAILLYDIYRAETSKDQKKPCK
jgi:RHS repeat-associated protein